MSIFRETRAMKFTGRAYSDFNVLLKMYQSKKYSKRQNEALVRAIEMLAAALGIKDWDWG